MKTLAGFLIRHASERDATSIAEIQIRTLQAFCQRLTPDDKPQALDFGSRTVEWKETLGTPVGTVLVAIKGIRMAGFCTLAPSNDPDAIPETAVIGCFCVDPPAWGRGAGRGLVEEVVAQARKRGYSRLTRWVVVADDRAKRFCEKAGFIPDGNEKTEEICGHAMRAVRFSMAL